MALSNTTQNALRTQYYDDWYTASNVDSTQLQGEYNDFHRILFRPKIAVQSRELTQLQTQLQAQLERLGKSSFKDGEAVFGGHLTLDTTVSSGQVTALSNLVAFFNRTTNQGKLIFDTVTTTQRAHVLQFMSADEGQVSNNYLLFKYQTAVPFAPSAVVQASDDAGITATFVSGLQADVFTSASVISIDEGIFFVSGFFVRVRQQTIVLNPFSSLPSYRIGLTITEEFIDELDDVVGASLLDPANANAPGAHRFRISLTLDKRSLDNAADTNFIELARVINGELQAVRETPRFVRFDELNNILARRTYDESGNYVVKTFAPVIQTDPDDSNNFIVAVGPGKAYVRGFEVNSNQTIKKSLRKGRSTANASSRSIPLTVGNFVYTIRVQASDPTSYFANTSLVDIHCVNVALINTSSTASYSESKIGQARVRMLEPWEVPSTISLYANNTITKMFFYDVSFDVLTGNLIAGTVNGSAITVSVLTGNGFPVGDAVGSVNSAIVGATIILGGASSPVSGTFTVNNYTANATAAYVTLAEFLPTLPNANTTYKLLFQPRDLDSFALRDAAVAAIDAPYYPRLSFQADVDTNSKDNGNPTGTTIVSDTNDNMLVYQIPETYLKANTMTVNTVIWKAWVKTSANAQGLGGASNLNFTLTVSGANFSLPTGNLSATTAQENLLIFDQSNLTNGHGILIEFADSGNTTNRFLSNVNVTQSGSDYNILFTYHNGAVSAGTHSLVGLAKTTITGLPVRTKTLYIGNTSAALANTTGALSNGQIEFHTLNVSPGAVYSLKTTDVWRISKIWYKADNTAFSNTDLSTATDVTSLFALDTGQRDNSYEYSQLTVLVDAGITVHPTGRLLVIFDWFDHGGRGYASVDSYLSDANIIKGMTYDTIPNYTSPKYNRAINLRSLLDFRPVRAHTSFASANLVYASTDTSNDATYLTVTSDSYLFPVSDDIWFGSYEYYLARIDKMSLSYDNTINVQEGLDAVSPQPPLDTDSNLLLFQLTIPPYTIVDSNGVPTGVTLQTFHYRRYTMQDLARLDTRVTHLEYYTSLNNLERVTNDTSLVDADGLDRFKNGIIVDPFVGFALADVAQPDFTASIDPVARQLRSAFNTFVLSFAGDTSNSTSYNTKLVGDMAVLSYNTEAFITQSLATHAVSVNPFDIANYYGNIKLSPAVDIWKDTINRPAQVIDLGGPDAAWVNAHNVNFTQWGEWDSTFSGAVTGTGTVTNAPNDPNWINHPWEHPIGQLLETTYQEVTTSSTRARQGTAFGFNVTAAHESLGNIVRDISVIHNIRARDVLFAGDGLRPAGTLYPFFDGTNVTKYVQQGDVLKLASQTLPAVDPFFMGQTVYVKKALTGNVATLSGNTTLTGTGSKWTYELVAGQMVRIVQGVNTFDAYVNAISTDTSATLITTASQTLANATVFTLTPVTVADYNKRISGNTVVYTLKVVRATLDADIDSATPYPITAGCLRPDKMVQDGANTTTGATLLQPASPRVPVANSYTIDAAICRSGVVRAYSTATGKLRFDLDIQDSSVATPGTVIHFVAGPGAGQSANVVSYTTANQTAVLDTSSLSNITAGQSIYSVGQPVTDGFLANSTITSGRAGTVAGIFHIPAGLFPVGTRQFRLTDSANNIPRDASTFADATYEASGLSQTQQDVSVTSRSLGITQTGTVSEAFSTSETHTQEIGQRWVDPLAETILVDGVKYPQGVFVTSIDLCFAGKPTDDIPVILELRPVINGYPSSLEILPCVSPTGYAVVTLRNDQVNTSSAPSMNTASTYTRFEFAAPIHLMPGKEYAIIVRSDSDLYTVYTAELGSSIIGSDAKVSKQPYAGSFFKSQNASTWTESPFEDLMFRINKAIWTASDEVPLSGILVARAVPPATNTFFDSIEFYPHQVQFSDKTATSFALDIKPQNLTTGDLTGAVAVRYAIINNTWMPLSNRSMVQGYGGTSAANNIAGRFFLGGPSIGAANTIDALFSLSTKSPDVAPYVDMKKVNLLGVQHLINNMGLYSNNVTFTNRGAGYLPTLRAGTITSVSGNSTLVGVGTAFDTVLVAGDTLVLGGNLEFVVSSITNATQLVATTNATASRAANVFHDYGTSGANNAVVVTITVGNGADASAYATVGRNGKLSNTVFSNTGSGYSGTPLLAVPAPDACTGYTIAQTTGTLSYNSELSANGGNALTRYRTHSVTLADGFDARDIVVIFDAYRPLGSHFYVYYKAFPANADTARFDDQPWRLMTQVTKDATVSNRITELKEFEFQTPNSRALDSVVDTTDKFKVWAIKVVMASSGTTDVPRIANFRAIALDE